MSSWNYTSKHLCCFSGNVKYFRGILRLTQKELASKIGVTGKTVGSWERGEVGSIRKGNVGTLASLLSTKLGISISLNELLTRDYSKGDFATGFAAGFPNGIPAFIPILPSSLAGQDRDFTTPDYSPENGYKTVDRPPDMSENNCYAYRIENDLAEPLLKSGDVVVLSPGGKFVNGDLYLVKNSSGVVYIARVHKKDNIYVLTHLNPRLEAQILEEGEVSAIHRIEWIRKT